MASLLSSESTTFTLDSMGRYLCNTIQEAIDSSRITAGGRPRDFDVIIVGGGTFGSVIAEELFSRDTTHSRRILVLDGGPFVLPEHVQNLPFGAALPDFRVPWQAHSGLRYDVAGLLFALGGRSLTWGGWSPELLHDSKNDEMVRSPQIRWPQTVIDYLKGDGFHEAGEQIGVNSTNDFIYGTLHENLRKRLHDILQAANTGPLASLKLDDLPPHPIVRSHKKRTGQDPGVDLLREWLNLPPTDNTLRPQLLDLLKLEAPLAVQARTEPGLFPFNKFSALPLLIQAARIASGEATGVGPEADARKRLMVVGSCHIQELVTETQADNWVRVTGVRVIAPGGASHLIPLAPPAANRQTVVILASGTVESTRVALTTFQLSLSGRAAKRMGRNLMAHLRSNLTIRVRKDAIPGLSAAVSQALQASALFVKGKAKINGTDRFFHLQITASGLGKLGDSSEAELFKKIPDTDAVQAMLNASDTHVVITLRGIGEMSPRNPDSNVALTSSPPLDFDRPRAQVSIGNAHNRSGSQQTINDHDLWNAMDTFTDELAVKLANGQPFEILGGPGGKTIALPANAKAADVKAAFPHQPPRRDGLGTTHHEAGTLWMGDDVADSVTNDYGRIHDTTNCYVAAPALFPTAGSPNPMLTGVALARRTAELLNKNVLPRPELLATEPGFTPLFDGTSDTFKKWRKVGDNHFALLNGEILTYGNGPIALLYYAAEAFDNFTLRAQFRIFDVDNHNSGIFVRFRNPLTKMPDEILRHAALDQDDLSNLALTAVHSGFEIQIDDKARGDSRRDFYGVPETSLDPQGGLRKNRTGAIYKIPAKDFVPHQNRFDDELQIYNPGPALVPGPWYEFQIKVVADTYEVRLRNLDDQQDTRTSSFQNPDNARGVARESGQPVGYIGIQSYPNALVAFRHIRIKRGQ